MTEGDVTEEAYALYGGYHGVWEVKAVFDYERKMLPKTCVMMREAFLSKLFTDCHRSTKKGTYLLFMKRF